MRRTMLAAMLVLAGCARSRPVVISPEAVRPEIEALFAHGAAAWSRGDLDGFMSDYAEDATYVTPRGVVHGRAAIRARYAPRFGPGGVRDSLHFEDLEIDVLGPDAVNAIAFYVLTRGDSVTARGPTSLLLRKSGGRWRIVHDHSS